MKSDIILVDFNNLDPNALELPKEKFSCYILCNHTQPNAFLVEKLIKNKAKDINACGKYATLWEEYADEICADYESDDLMKEYWGVTTESTRLDSFIFDLAFEHCEYYNDEALSHDPILLFYDDENLKNFVLKRVEWLLEDTSIPDPHDNDENYDYDKDFKQRRRIELNAHTNRTRFIGVDDVEHMISAARDLRQGGIAITDYNSTQSLIEAYRLSKNMKNFKVLYGIETESRWLYNVRLLCKNAKGKIAINKYLTHLFTSKDRNITYKSDGEISLISSERQKIIDDNRDDLLIGLSYNSNTMTHAILGEEWINEIHEDIVDCDYVEIAPIATYKLFYPNETDDSLKKAIRLIIDVAKKEGKLVVAVSSPYYAYENSYLEFSILWKDKKCGELPDDYKGYLYSTEEMRYAFDWLNDDALVEEIVVTNTHKIADMCEDFEPFDNTFHMPYIKDAYDKLESRVVKKMIEIYGTDVDRIITYRLETELKLIKDNGFASIYMLAAGICDESRAQGYKYSYRGAIGASLVGYLLGISECNPLPPHTICPNCHRVVWNATVASGYDIEPHECRECGHIAKGEGQNIPYQTFMAIDGSRVPDIDLNLDPLFRENIVDVIKKVAPENSVVRAGTINTIRYKDAAEMVSDFASNNESVIDNETREDLIRTISNVVANQGKHPGGYIIVPKDVNINDITPLIKVDGDIVTHLEYHDISDNLYKVDCLEHADPAALRYMELLGLNLDEIDINDPKIYELLNEDNGTLGIPELGSHYTSFILEKIKPKKFSDLVKISGFAHGTHVWTTNAEELFEEGMPLDELLATRDDVYNVLRFKYNLDENDAYKIMERVRKGKGLEEEQVSLLKEHNVLEWFIESCNKIMYMFPKAHTIIYLINALKFAWVKLYKPAYFYAQYLEFREGETYDVAKEMDERGIKVIDQTKDGEHGHFAVNPENENGVLYIGEC